MAKSQPKKYINKVKLTDSDYGLTTRKSYAKTIVQNVPVFPKPLEYVDIDKAFYEFVDTDLKMVFEDKALPTFTLFSNQRFSEYSQTWQHTDEEGNLLMNFKTINRENNPSQGENQGGLWNIPGEQRYTLLIKEVMEDNGNECYEIYSMTQPYCVDIKYRLGIITNTFENINKFNQLINKTFASRQFYIRPNGHYVPLILDNIDDDSEYSIADRKFFSQVVTIKALAYIINSDDFKVERKPKNIKLFMYGDSRRPKPKINIEEYFDDKIEFKSIDMIIDLKEFVERVEFDIDTDFTVNSIELFNIDSIKVSVNNIPFFIEKGFILHNGDNVKIQVKHEDPSRDSQIKFIGYNHSEPYIKHEIPIDVSDDVVKHENISVE